MGKQHFLIEAQFVVEVLGAVRSLEIPGADCRVSRAFLWKNQAVPLVSLIRCLALDGMSEGQHRILILELAEGIIAVGAERVGAIITASRDAFFPPEIPDSRFLPARLRHDGVSAHLLDLPALVGTLVQSTTVSNPVE